jgi:hypothetical protein
MTTSTTSADTETRAQTDPAAMPGNKIGSELASARFRG